MNLLIIGHRQHGKTDVGNLLAKVFNVKAHDSSWYACENIVYPNLKDKYGYRSPEEAHVDRGKHRQEWFELIEDFNDEPDRLTKAILSDGNIYVGMRSRMEYTGSRHHFDYVIWVDASKRVPEEDSSSMKLTRFDADYVLDNNGPLEDLPQKVGILVEWLMFQKSPVDKSVQVFDMSPEHYLGRGLLSEFIMQRLVSTPEAGLEEETFGPLDELGVVSSHFKDSRAMGNYDIAMRTDGATIAAVDPSIYERSFDNLQKRIQDWATLRFPEATHESRFKHLTSELKEILENPSDVIEWADALLILIHGMVEEGFSMQNDILPAAYRKLDELHRRQYYYDDEGNLRWTLDN